MANRYQNGASTPGPGFGGVGANRPGTGLTSVPYQFMPQSFPFPSMHPAMGQPAPMPLDIAGHMQGVYHQSGAPPGPAMQMFPGGVLAAPFATPMANQQRGTMTAAGQRAWQDEQQRHKDKQLKERDYLQQQQRLRQFGSGGGEKLNSDKFIQNMFGASEASSRSSSSSNKRKTDLAPPTHPLPRVAPPARPHPQSVLSTLSVSGLANSFQASQKARDWSNLEDLHNVFSPPTANSGLPPWCQAGAVVPHLYTQIEQYASRQGVIDTSVLYPVLVSSGLSRETLGHIWTLANRQTPGQLNRFELYAVLALIALAQNACQITSLDILHTLHAPPIPLFNQIGSPPSVQSVTSANPTLNSPAEGVPLAAPAVAVSTPTSSLMPSDDFDDFQTASVASSVPSLSVTTFSTASGPRTVTSGSVGSRLANHRLAHSPGNQRMTDLLLNGYIDTTTVQDDQQMPDDFSDFQCARPRPSTSDQLDQATVESAPSQPHDPTRSQHSPASSNEHRRTCSDGGVGAGGFRAITLDKLVPGLLSVSPTVQHFPVVLDPVERQSPPAVPEPSWIPTTTTTTTTTNDGFDRYSVFRTLDDPTESDTVAEVEDDFGDFLGGGSTAVVTSLPVVTPAAPPSYQTSALPPLYDPYPVVPGMSSDSGGGYDFFDPLGSLGDDPTPPAVAGQLHSLTGFNGGHLFPPPPPSARPPALPAETSRPETNGGCVAHRSSSPATLPAHPNTTKLMSRVMSQMHGIHDVHDNDDDDFGDFIAPSSSRVEPDTGSAGFGMSGFLGRQLGDSASCDGQSVSSLDLASGADLPPSGVAVLGRHGSVPSLDLKVFGSWDQEEEEDEEAAAVTVQEVEGQLHDQTGVIAVPPGQWGAAAGIDHAVQRPPLTVLPVSVLSSVPAIDRYSLIRGDVAPPGGEGVHAYEWRRCLDNCYQFIRNALNIFNGVSSSGVSNEVTNSEEGENYIKNIIQVYRISCRISQSTKNSNRKHNLDSLFNDIETEWNKLLSFILGSPNFPREEYFNFELDVLPTSSSDNNLLQSCGVCLLNVDSSHGGTASGGGGQQQVGTATTDNAKLSYGGRQYHSTCANFWVNCVDSLLPALPQLIQQRPLPAPIRLQQRQRTT